LSLKILMVSGSVPDIRCGIGDYTARLATELARRPDVSVTILTTRHDRVRLDAASPAVIQPAAGWGLQRLVWLVRAIRQHKPDIVHIQYPAVGYGRGLGIILLPVAVRWFCRVPVVLTIHERRERSRLARLAIDLMALSSSLVVTLDPIEASDLEHALSRFSPQVVTGMMISTVPVAANVDRRAVRRRVGASLEDLVVVTFGLIHPRRRIEDIIDAVGELRRSSTAARLWIVGGEAEYDPNAARAYGLSLRERARSLGLDAVIHWMNHVDPADVSAFLQAADVAVFLYPDGASGRNTTLQAAREHGLPVVTTVGPATSDALRQLARVVFLRVGEYTAVDLADAIVRAQRLGANGAQAPSDALNLREHVEFHISAYQRLLKHERPGADRQASLESRPR
jgi:glycosyltransferase involved in cell wall biosynthesis